MFMAKFAEPHQLQDSIHNYNISVLCFKCFQTNSPSVFQSNQSIAPVDIFCPINNKGLCKQLSSYTKGKGGGGYSPKYWVGVRRTVLKTLTLF